VSLFFFNKLYNKMQPPKVVDVMISVEMQQELFAMLVSHTSFTEQKLIIVEMSS